MSVVALSITVLPISSSMDLLQGIHMYVRFYHLETEPFFVTPKKTLTTIVPFRNTCRSGEVSPEVEAGGVTGHRYL
jgi:hypothetical protein